MLYIRTMASSMNGSDVLDPKLLSAMIFATITLEAELKQLNSHRAHHMHSISSPSCHQPQNLTCLKTNNPHPWCHIHRKHQCIRLYRHVTKCDRDTSAMSDLMLSASPTDRDDEDEWEAGTMEIPAFQLPPSFTDTGTQTDTPPAVICTFSTIGVHVQTVKPSVITLPAPTPRNTPSWQPPTLPATSSYGLIHDRTPHILATVFPYQASCDARISALLWGSETDPRCHILDSLPAEYKVFIHILWMIARLFPDTEEMVFRPLLIPTICKVVEDWLEYQMAIGVFCWWHEGVLGSSYGRPLYGGGHLCEDFRRVQNISDLLLDFRDLFVDYISNRIISPTTSTCHEPHWLIPTLPTSTNLSMNGVTTIIY